MGEIMFTRTNVNAALKHSFVFKIPAACAKAMRCPSFVVALPKKSHAKVCSSVWGLPLSYALPPLSICLADPTSVNDYIGQACLASVVSPPFCFALDQTQHSQFHVPRLTSLAATLFGISSVEKGSVLASLFELSCVLLDLNLLT